jgi:hypothetical protein
MLSSGTPAPIRPPRILIEDPNLELSDSAPSRTPAYDLIVCSGPASETEECPLVMNGACPLGRFDVVVGALQGPWATSVRAAWAEAGAAYVDARNTAEDPTERVACHVGAAVQALVAPYCSGE